MLSLPVLVGFMSQFQSKINTLQMSDKSFTWRTEPPFESVFGDVAAVSSGTYLPMWHGGMVVYWHTKNL